MNPAELANALRRVAGEFRERQARTMRTPDRIAFDDGVFSGIILAATLTAGLDGNAPAPAFDVSKLDA